MVWTYLGDALWVAALTIMFGASRQAGLRLTGPTVRLFGGPVPRAAVLWALPAGTFLLSLYLAWTARIADLDSDGVLILLGIRALGASLAALAHLHVLRSAHNP